METLGFMDILNFLLGVIAGLYFLAFLERFVWNPLGQKLADYFIAKNKKK